MHDIVGRAWVSARAEHGPVAGIWLLSKCDWTSGHKISHKKYTRVQHRDCESGLAKHAAQARPAHAAGHVEMAWTDESHLFWYAQLIAPIVVARRDLSPVTGTMSQATKANNIDRLPCGYLYHSRHWTGKSTSSLCSCCRHRSRLFMVRSSQYMPTPMLTR